jgi:hypothetical protein
MGLVRQMPLAATTLLCTVVCGFGDLEDLALARWHGTASFTLVEGFAGDNAVDLCVYRLGQLLNSKPNQIIPVRMFWKASSTLLASRAEVSMKDKLFSPNAYRQPRPLCCR